LLQADPASVFVQNLAVKQRVGNAYAVLRGRVLTIVTGARTERETLDSPAALVATLHDWFKLDVPEAATLWPRICARHAALFQDDSLQGSA
jgi:N-hydroxyarylamine O-acetyltransferase